MTTEDKVVHHTMGHVLAQAAQTAPVSIDPELVARLSANTMKQIIRAQRRAVVKAKLARFWWAPLRNARALMRLFTD
jgi:hypothetical protein